MPPHARLLSGATLLALSCAVWLVPALGHAVPAPQACDAVQSVALPAASLGQPYARGLVIKGGKPPFTVRRTSGTLGALGLSLSPEGRLSGTPVATGAVRFCVEALSAAGGPAVAQIYQLTVSAPGPARSASRASAGSAAPAASAASVAGRTH